MWTQIRKWSIYLRVNENKMNIILVHKREWPSLSPSSVASTFNAHALAQRGHNVFLIVGKGNNKSYNENLKSFYEVGSLPNLHIIPINKFKRISFSSSFPFFIQAIKVALNISRYVKIDSIITRDTGFIKYLPFLKKRTEAKILYETHNYFLDKTTFGRSKKNNRAWKKYNRIEKLYIPKIDGIICLLSHQEKLYKKKFPSQNIYTAHPGISKVEKINETLIKNKRLCYLGDLSKRRDIDTMLNAIHQLDDKEIELLIIGGKDNELDRINKMAQERNIQNKIKLTGWVSYKEMRSFLKTVAVGLVPMKPTFYNRFLTAPMKIFDYMTCSIPVIAADMESSREFIEEDVNGIFYQPENSKDLVRKIEKMFQSKERLNDFRNKTNIKAKSMLWNKRAINIENIINKINFRNKTNIVSTSTNHELVIIK